MNVNFVPNFCRFIVIVKQQSITLSKTEKLSLLKLRLSYLLFSIWIRCGSFFRADFVVLLSLFLVRFVYSN